MNISHIKQSSGIDYISSLSNRRSNPQKAHPSTSSTDSVSISSEAMEKYLAMKNAAKSQENTDVVSQVTSWYDNFREKMGNVNEPDYSTLPIEYLARREKLLAERDALAPHCSNTSFTETNRKMNGIMHELMALDATGGQKVLSDSDMNAAVNALCSAMDRWEKVAPGTSAYLAGKGSAISQQSVLDSIQEGAQRTGHAKPISKSMYSMLLESLFIAELEESGAIGNNEAEASANERQASGEETAHPQANKTKLSNPLEDGSEVAQIKKVLADFAKGKADLSDISSAIGGGDKSAGKMESGNAVGRSSDDKKNEIA